MIKRRAGQKRKRATSRLLKTQELCFAPSFLHHHAFLVGSWMGLSWIRMHIWWYVQRVCAIWQESPLWQEPELELGGGRDRGVKERKGAVICCNESGSILIASIVQSSHYLPLRYRGRQLRLLPYGEDELLSDGKFFHYICVIPDKADTELTFSFCSVTD